MLASYLLKKLINTGSLQVIDANGKRHLFRGTDHPTVTIRLHDRKLHHRLLTNPRLALGEGYMSGDLTVEDASLYDFLDLIGRNMALTGRLSMHGFAGILNWLVRPLHQFNPTIWARSHVAHHYDLSGELFDLFLDQDKQYSCAYFTGPNDSLEQAQEEKKRHISAKLLAEPGHNVLDVGCGWGGLAIYLAQETGANVTGLTLSNEQLNVARKRVHDNGLSNNVFIHQRDYREQTGQFDRIVSVGMFEHVGINHYKTYFNQVYDLLKDDGIFLLHTIGRMKGPGVTDPWIRKYIFPGGYIPALSEIVKVIERTGLTITDVEVLRLHYAKTLKHWRSRFLANRERAKDLYDERFCRMWEYYLASCEIAFRYLSTAVYQIQITKQQQAVPLTRDYINRIKSEMLLAKGRDRRHAA